MGPRNVSDPTNPQTPQVYGLVANETYCFVQCLNHAGTYNPALLLVNTMEATYEEFRTLDISIEEYEISFRHISTCEAANNYTMEFEYYFYPRSAQLDGAVIVCGVIHPHSQPPCWGQSYAVISYDVDDPTTYTMPTSPTTTTTTTTAINNTDLPTTSPTTTGTTHTPSSTGPSSTGPATSDPSTTDVTTSGIAVTNPATATNTITHIVVPIIVCLFGILVAVSIAIIVMIQVSHKKRVVRSQVNPHSATGSHGQL